MKKIILPLADSLELVAGDEALLTGVIYSARDQAHKRLAQMIAEGRTLPFDLKGQVIYYMGPAPTPEGFVIGSAGPTTSGRMDPFAPCLLEKGLKGMIGKGYRSPEVIDAIKKYRAVYFYAFGGCGALYAECIKKVELVAFEDLGPEAVFRLYVENFPVITAVDAEGCSALV